MQPAAFLRKAERQPPAAAAAVPHQKCKQPLSVRALPQKQAAGPALRRAQQAQKQMLRFDTGMTQRPGNRPCLAENPLRQRRKILFPHSPASVL